jgi:hypothetical protein
MWLAASLAEFSGGYEHRVVDKLTTLRMMRGVVVLS